MLPTPISESSRDIVSNPLSVGTLKWQDHLWAKPFLTWSGWKTCHGRAGDRSWQWLHPNVDAFNATQPHIIMVQMVRIIGYVYFSTINKVMRGWVELLSWKGWLSLYTGDIWLTPKPVAPMEMDERHSSQRDVESGEQNRRKHKPCWWKEWSSIQKSFPDNSRYD